MISQNIKALRMQKGLTQKELADLLHVTSQAVSRWEKGDVEPSIDTLNKMSKIFNRSIDEIIGELKDSSKDELEEKIQTTVQTQVSSEIQNISNQVSSEMKNISSQVTQPLPVLAVCEHCNKPIYNGDEIVRITFGPSKGSTICSSCNKKRIEDKLNDAISYGVKQRTKAYIWSSVFAVLVLLFTIFTKDEILLGLGTETSFNSDNFWIIPTLLTITTFTFSFCIFVQNNFLGSAFCGIVSWGCVKFPGIIFSFDIDGFIAFIVLKVLFCIVGFVIGLITIVLALMICLPLSLFVFPYALIKNLNHPERNEEFEDRFSDEEIEELKKANL